VGALGAERLVQRVPEAAATRPRCATEQRERVGPDADDRRRQDREERLLVAGIDQRGEVAGQVEYLLAGPESAAAGGERGEPLVLERALEGLHVRARPQQDAHVAGPTR